MEFWASLIGAITGLLSLAGVVYLAGYWKGGVDTTLQEIKHYNQLYPPAEIAHMVKTLWDIYVLDPLRARPDLAEHRSPYRLTVQAQNLIPPGLKRTLDGVNFGSNSHEAIASGYLVVKVLGIEPISQMAQEKGLSMQEAIAVLSTYLDDKLQIISLKTSPPNR